MFAYGVLDISVEDEESRLIKWVVEEAMQVEKKSNWQKDLEKSLVELGWVQFPESEA